MAGDLRPLTEQDAPHLVEATSTETRRSLWGHQPAGSYTLADAVAALRAWDRDTSYGVFEGDRLVAAVGLMPDGPGNADRGGFTRLWLEINPTNTASLRVAERAGYTFERRLPDHCRNEHSRHDCLIWVHLT